MKYPEIMDDTAKLEFIERYLGKSLDRDELIEFKKLLAEDPEFAELVGQYSIAIKSIELFGKNNLKQQLKAIHHEEIGNTRSWSRKSWFKIAAVFVSLIALGSLLYMNSFRATDAQQLYTAYFKQYPDVISHRGIESGYHQLLEEAMRYYKNLDYETAAILFDEFKKSDTTYTNIIALYSGISLLELNKSSESAAVFLEIIQNPDHLFGDQAKWYLALSYLRNNDTNSAIEILREISLLESYNYLKAREILEKLR